MRNWLLVGLLGLLVACGGGGGGNSASGVEPGPPPPGGSVPPAPEVPPPSPAPYAEAEELRAFITKVTIPDDGQPVVDWQLADGSNVAITDLEASDVRFTIAKLESSPLGNLTGSWQSYKNTVEDPEVGTGTESRVQATYERGTGGGEFTNNGDGTYRFRFALNVTDIPDVPEGLLALADSEGLNLDYQPELTHRVAMQFDNAPGKANPFYDWEPATGATEGIFHMQIAATDNCNRCHDPLALHGNGRIEVEYCVTCHNPGSTDSDSTNTVDMKVLIHKLHRGANLPSVQAGGQYVIYGFNNGEHDYSHVHFPQDIRNCVNCHAGSASADQEYPVGSGYALTPTSQGDNWWQVPSQAACGSCHDDVDFDSHRGGQPDDSRCASCHSEGGPAGSIQDSHLIPRDEAREKFAADILSVTNTAPGQFPQVQYKVFDPTNGNAPYDLQNDPVWTMGNDSRLEIDLAWATTDYTNSGNGEDTAGASAVGLDALQGTPVGDGSYLVESDVAIPDGSEAPHIPANGSGVAGIEGHPAVDIGSAEEPDVQRISFTSETEFFSINEADGQADPRRTVVDLNNCLNCHQTLSLHGSNRTDHVQLCVTCHNPRNTDREVREIAASPPTDGKDEESIDFKTMVHGIHAAAMRVNALQIVGFGGFSTHVYDEEEVQFPGDLANCIACHDDDTYTLPLAAGVLATTVDTGADHDSPVDDTVTTPTTAVCSSCHDDSVAAAHMTSNGGSFDTTQKAIDDGEVVEQCTICHGSGRDADVAKVHNPHPKPIQ
jgi:OmcA/MtrC family decaheme c-type cytochrome